MLVTHEIGEITLWPSTRVVYLRHHQVRIVIQLCLLLCFIKPILGNCYVRSWGFIVSEPRETHTRSEIADVCCFVLLTRG